MNVYDVAALNWQTRILTLPSPTLHPQTILIFCNISVKSALLKLTNKLSCTYSSFRFLRLANKLSGKFVIALFVRSLFNGRAPLMTPYIEKYINLSFSSWNILRQVHFNALWATCCKGDYVLTFIPPGRQFIRSLYVHRLFCSAKMNNNHLREKGKAIA